MTTTNKLLERYSDVPSRIVECGAIACKECLSANVMCKEYTLPTGEVLTMTTCLDCGDVEDRWR